MDGANAKKKRRAESVGILEYNLSKEPGSGDSHRGTNGRGTLNGKEMAVRK